MAKKTKRQRIDREKASDYAAIGDDFLRGAELAMDDERWNAAGLLLVHAAIATADAVCIKLSGMRSTSDNHQEAVTLLKEVTVASDERGRAVQQLRRIITEKNAVAYGGQRFRRRGVEALKTRADRFHAWARTILDS